MWFGIAKGSACLCDSDFCLEIAGGSSCGIGGDDCWKGAIYVLGTLTLLTELPLQLRYGFLADLVTKHEPVVVLTTTEEKSNKSGKSSNHSGPKIHL
jgi:hypothetical protein